MSGAIPAELGGLSNLKILYLNNNQLREEVPAEFGSLSKLTYLTLSANQLSGEIPPELGSLANLEYLSLRENRLSGEIPPELGGLSNLEWLTLSNNQLRGEIPPELGGLSNLVELGLSGNQLRGCIPSGLRDVKHNDLSYTGLQFCGISPPTPTPASVLSAERAALKAFYAATNGADWHENRNWLSDAPLGEWHGVTTDDSGRVIGLNLLDNQLSGEIPPELGGLSNLADLYLSGNQLSGCIPSGLRYVPQNDFSDTRLPFCG